ncbi:MULTISPECIES: hypothetical protein [unclassified Streptomyces]|uniref:hypothetical protein n=1 Tax=unclassified Streptomyces TaxID=2593676 RepID=UPI002256F913|nr:hypothetical protein [Streptomyces sp. NBC_01214]MCX4805437.1 hypothetical protein [Streptomyces sp. NBC_01214]
MSIRRMVKVRGGMAVAGMAAMVLMLAGCGGSDEKPKSAKSPSAAQSQGGNSQAPGPTGSKSAVPAEVIATVKGPSSIVLNINSAVREAGNFVTVSGQIKNDGTEAYVETAAWRGDEKTASAASVAGATVVDKQGKKRYYVLRDTEGRCSCTIGITRIGPGESIPFFAQFPAPPTSATEVDFTIPTFATATIKISG